MSYTERNPRITHRKGPAVETRTQLKFCPSCGHLTYQVRTTDTRPPYDGVGCFRSDCKYVDKDGL